MMVLISFVIFFELGQILVRNIGLLVLVKVSGLCEMLIFMLFVMVQVIISGGEVRQFVCIFGLMWFLKLWLFDSIDMVIRLLLLIDLEILGCSGLELLMQVVQLKFIRLKLSVFRFFCRFVVLRYFVIICDFGVSEVLIQGLCVSFSVCVLCVISLVVISIQGFEVLVQEVIVVIIIDLL